jgi:[acyl-carrier-protein] S-malonyltransferase
MGRELYETHRSRVEPFYRRAREALGFDLQGLIFGGPEEQLRLTEFAQPAILLDSVIKFELLGQMPHYAAGHSLGEYSALVCAGVLSLEDGAASGASARAVDARGGPRRCGRDARDREVRL